MKLYKTHDLNLAAFLKVAKLNYLGIEKDSPHSRRVSFLFEDNGQVQELIHAFISRSPQHSRVVALDYADELKALKSATKV